MTVRFTASSDARPYHHRHSCRPCTVLGILTVGDRGHIVFIDGTAGNTTRPEMMPERTFYALYELGEGVPYEGEPSDG